MSSLLRFSFSGIVFFQLFASLSVAQTIHLILAVDGNSNLGGGNMSADMRNMRQTFERNIPEDRLYIERLSIDDLTAEEMLEAVEKLEVEHHDSVIFYYSGEGGYVKDRDEPFFQLSNGETLSRKKVEELLRKKKVRLTVLLTDCCQSLISVPPSPIEKDTEEVERPEEFSPLFQTLFLESVGFVDLASCQAGEPSYTDPTSRNRGSYFTRCLTELWEKESKNQETHWRKIANDVNGNVLRLVKKEVQEKYSVAEKPQRVLLRSAPDIKQKAPGGVRFGAFVLEDGDSSGGLLVTHVYEGSSATKVGLCVDDRILAVNGTEVATEKDCLELIKDARQSIKLRFFSSKQGREIDVLIPLAY